MTGTELDSAPPLFGGVRGSDWTFERHMDDCTDRLEDRFLFDIELSPVEDDGPTTGLVLRVFQTRGPHVDPTAPEPVLVRGWPLDGDRVRVTRTESSAVGRVCFSAIVTDLVGQASAGAERETCLTTVEPPFFEGCRLSTAPRRGTTAGLVVLAAMGAVALWRSGRRRR